MYLQWAMQKKGEQTFLTFESENEESEEGQQEQLKTSASLAFLQTVQEKTLEPIRDEREWSLHANGTFLSPLSFSNGKTQVDVVKEIVAHIKQGKKTILLRGVCGTGKSAIALHLARELGKTSIVVPVKGLQRQYEEDYASKKTVLKRNGKPLTIAMITGRENHDSVIKPGVSCADPLLPDTIKISEKNAALIYEYYQQNPYFVRKDMPPLKNIKRISIAPANPYWSPLVPAALPMPLKDARKLKYRGLEGKDFIFYQRKLGCSYYDQYLAYVHADVVIFNAAKYKIEVALDRKPETVVDIIDEADEFLDSFSLQEELNLTRLQSALKSLHPEQAEAQVIRDALLALVKLEEQNKQALGVDASQIFKIADTQLFKLLRLFLQSDEFQAEILGDELQYANKALEIAEAFKGLLDETYVTFRKHEGELHCSLITTNLSQKFAEIRRKSKALVLMSGTLHAPDVLRTVFGVDDFVIVEAETHTQGTVELVQTGKEFDCRYAHFTSGKHSRKEYLHALDSCLAAAVKPVLVHVHAFEDLPTETEREAYELKHTLSRDMLHALQKGDTTGRLISLFKAKLADTLFTTKCSRGVDFPGDVCNSIVFTKYPNPNVQSMFWKILQQTHPSSFWSFYRDKAEREFLQRIYRGLRSKEDHVRILSPDSRVLDAVRRLQNTLSRNLLSFK